MSSNPFLIVGEGETIQPFCVARSESNTAKSVRIEPWRKALGKPFVEEMLVHKR